MDESWTDAVCLVNNLDGVRPLEKLGVNWAADLAALLAPSIRILGVIGTMPTAVIAASRPPNGMQVMPITVPALSQLKAGEDSGGLPMTPDLLIANCRGYPLRDVAGVLSLLCGIPVPSIVEFDALVSDTTTHWLDLVEGHAQARIFDVTGEEIVPGTDARTLGAGCLALVPRQTSPSALHKAIITRLSRRTGVPPQSRVLSPQPYVRTVEVVSLETAARLAGFRYERRSLGEANFNIYNRKYDETPKMFEVASCRDVDLIPHPAWKICVQDRFFVEELGYSNKNTIFGMEYWPEFRGYWTIRRQAPQILISRRDGPYLLLGGDNAYYHWVLNWVPRLMAADVMAEHLAPLRSLKVVVPHAQLLEVPEFLTLLYEIGVPPENVVHLHENAVWRFEELLVPSLFHNDQLSASVAQWYRRHLRPANSSTSMKRIIISRRDAFQGGPPRRRVINEDAVVAALAPLGFQRYELSSLSIREQIELFQEADMVIGPHGAGFANMTFSPPSAKALVFENSFNQTFMVDMVNVGGGVAKSMLCEDVIDSSYEAQHMVGSTVDMEVRRNRDMKVDIELLLQTVKDWTSS